MKLLNPFFIAVSMYTRIPVPMVEWNEKNMRNALCFFPAAGIFIGSGLVILYQLAHLLQCGAFLFGAFSTGLVLMITGGIHMDGFCDTMDALSSHRSREEKLEIMKDSRCGSFSVMWMCICLLMQCAAFSKYYNMNLRVFSGMCIVFVLSRALSGISIAVFKKAPTSSLANTFSRYAGGLVPWILAGVFFIAASMGILLDWKIGTLITVISITVFIYYKSMAQKQFGGTTGDVAGYFLVLSETVCLCVSALLLKG